MYEYSRFRKRVQVRSWLVGREALRDVNSLSLPD
jgi:hypothetical protein